MCMQVKLFILSAQDGEGRWGSKTMAGGGGKRALAKLGHQGHSGCPGFLDPRAVLSLSLSTPCLIFTLVSPLCSVHVEHSAGEPSMGEELFPRGKAGQSVPTASSAHGQGWG